MLTLIKRYLFHAQWLVFLSSISFADVSVDKPAPDFIAQDQFGLEHRLSELAGKITLLTFFAPDCQASIAAAIELEHRIWQPNRRRGVQLIAILLVDSISPVAKQTAVRDWVSAYSLTYPVLSADSVLAAQYGVRVTPAHYLLDGGLRCRHVSFGFDRAGLQDEIDSALPLPDQTFDRKEHQIAGSKGNRETVQPDRPRPKFGRGTSPAEDMSSSWHDYLAVPTDFTFQEDLSQCPDEDGDGFPSALVCPYGDPRLLDCDDHDPLVTPLREIWIPPGPFLMGSESDHAAADEQPVHVVWLSGYCLDRSEVCLADFADWLRAEGRKPCGSDICGFDSSGEPLPDYLTRPVEGVLWEDARDYCEYYGKTLPTEAQWEKAARGGCEKGDTADACDPQDLRPYPWGKQQPTCELANHQRSNDGHLTLCESATLPVDSMEAGAGPYGHLNLAGNVWEYVTDYYHPGVYRAGRKNPGGSSDGSYHVLRGGGWNTYSTNMRVANRFTDLLPGSATGFRCARASTPAVPDQVKPLETVTLSGTITHTRGKLSGRALVVSVFDVEETDAVTGMLAPGRGPVAEVRMQPNGYPQQTFSVEVPKGITCLVNAALDDGSAADSPDFQIASTSGGLGHAIENPVSALSDISDLHILLAPQVNRSHRNPGRGKRELPSSSGGRADDSQSAGAHSLNPSGYPFFHSLTPVPGPDIAGVGDWRPAVKLTSPPSGGYHPQIACGPDGLLHAVYYDRIQQGDVIRHRTSRDGLNWSDPVQVSFDHHWNWGPDILTRTDGSAVLVFDHARSDESGGGYITIWRDGKWNTPEKVTSDGELEISGMHVAEGKNGDLYCAWVSKKKHAGSRFQGHWRWFHDGRWSPVLDLTNGMNDAWHANVETSPDGQVLVGWDVGSLDEPKNLFVAQLENDRLTRLQNITLTGKPGERPHFAFAPDGTQYITWFRYISGLPLAIYVRGRRAGSWQEFAEPSQGYGGYHYDPEIACNDQGVLCLIWCWDGGDQAELVYSLNRGQGWEPPRLVAKIGWGKPGLPLVIADHNGVFHAIWNQGIRGYNEIYYSQLQVP